MNQNPEEKIVYTAHELKKVLGIGINQTYDLIRTNQFPVKHFGKKIVIPVKPFLEWLNSSQSDEKQCSE